LQLNLNTKAQVNRIQKYTEYFPNIKKDTIENICNIYQNFGREISMLETLNILTPVEIERFNIYEKEISDNQIDILLRLYEDKTASINDFIEFISQNMRNTNVSLSLMKIYDKLRLKYGKNVRFQKISQEFLNFELSNNTDATENLYLLNLIVKCNSYL
jgi:hypothetical protein